MARSPQRRSGSPTRLVGVVGGVLLVGAIVAGAVSMLGDDAGGRVAGSDAGSVAGADAVAEPAPAADAESSGADQPGIDGTEADAPAPSVAGDQAGPIVVARRDPGFWELMPTAVLGLGLPEPHPVTGQVVDEDGLPLVGVEVRVLPDEDLMFDIEIPLADDHWLHLDLFPSTLTDTEGRFALAVPRQWTDAGEPFGPRQALLMLAPHDGRQTRLVTAGPVEDEDRYDMGTVALAPAGTVVGRIVDEHARPQAGLHLCIEDWTAEASDDEDRGEDDEVADGPEDEAGGMTAVELEAEELEETGLELFCAWTDKDGFFRVEGIPTGDFNFDVRRPLGEDFYIDDVQPRAGEVLDLGTHVVPAGMRVAGRVLGAGRQPLRNATVVVATEDAWVADAELPEDLPWVVDEVPLSFEAVVTRTDAVGRFVVEGVEDRDVVIMAYAPGHRAARFSGLAEKDVESLALLLAPAPRLLIEVIAAGDGELLQGVIAAATGHPGRSEEYARPLPVTTGRAAARRAGLPSDGRGLVLVEELSSTITSIGLTAPGREYREITWVAGPEPVPGSAGGSAVTERLTVALQRETTVQGTVSWSEAGGPAAGARVALSGPYRWLEIEPQFTGDDGRYRFTGLGPDTWRLWATVPGWDQRAREELQVEAAQTIDLDLVLGGDAALHGTVRDATGRLLAGLPVTTRLAGSTTQDAVRHTRTDARGRYALEGLLAGERWVHALAGTGTVDIAPMSTAVVDLDAGRVASITGTLWLHADEVPGRVTLTPTKTSAFSRSSEVRSLDGTYLIHRSDAGVMKLRGTSSGGTAAGEALIDVTSGAEIRADLTLILGRGVLAGRITDAHSEVPLARARVALRPENEAPSMTFTDAEGRYRFEHLRSADMARVIVNFEGRQELYVSSLPEVGTRTLDLQLLPVGSLSGTVTLERPWGGPGAPSVHAVPLELDSRGVLSESARVEGGRYRFDDLAVGLWRIRPPGGGSGADDIFVTITPGEEARLDLVVGVDD